MHPLVKLVLIVVVIMAVVVLWGRIMGRRDPDRKLVGLTDAVRAKVSHEISAGHKLNAIKIYREATGAPLTDAKSAVDNWFVPGRGPGVRDAASSWSEGRLTDGGALAHQRARHRRSPRGRHGALRRGHGREQQRGAGDHPHVGHLPGLLRDRPGMHRLLVYGTTGKFTWRMLATVLGGEALCIALGALVARGLAATDRHTPARRHTSSSGSGSRRWPSWRRARCADPGASPWAGWCRR